MVEVYERAGIYSEFGKIVCISVGYMKLDEATQKYTVKLKSFHGHDEKALLIEFGKAVAQKVFDWAETDGYQHVKDPYTPPTGPGLWVPSPPAFAVAITPYWGNLRTIVPGSGNNTQPGAPTPYSTDPSSDFYKMAKHVYDASQTITPEQTAMALYWRDILVLPRQVTM